MAYFDLHCHPSLKAMFSKPINGRLPSCWEDVWVGVDNGFENILDSQSSLSQIATDGANLIVVALHAVEKAVTSQPLLGLIALMAGKELSNDRINELSKRPYKKGGIEYTYYSQLFEEVTNLTARLQNSAGTKKIKPIRSFSEYNQADKDTIHIIFSVEGSHCFFGMENAEVNKMVARLEEFNAQYRLLYVTLNHLEPHKYFNHAYGLKIFPKKKFLPNGNGIHPDGLFFIGQCYENNILVDIKHLSLKARKDFYAYRRKHYPEKPIIGSHMAVTGISWNSIPDVVAHVVKRPARKFMEVVYNLPSGYFDNTTFNPSSINLYDEEIIEIVTSNGIIGIIMDERVLGDSANKGYNEFVSWDEKDLFLKDDTIELEVSEIDEAAEDEIAMQELNEALDINRKMKSSHIQVIFNNIFHIVKIIRWYDDKLNPWDYICIGTDFDGIINPVDFCTNMGSLSKAHIILEENMTKLATEAGIPLGDTPANIVEKIMFKNGARFLSANFA